jgi:SAM-dependent methyltransferase
MTTRDADSIRSAVRERYASAALAAQESTSCCGRDAGSALAVEHVTCCGGIDAGAGFGSALYDERTDGLPAGAVAASLGCGNPTMLATLEEGQVVLDLGSGGGIDVLLSARRVGATGKVYGLDMTPEMLELARRNQAEAGAENVEFLLGTIEDIPLPDDSVDVIISNCVINLSADKDQVLREAHRVLRPGGLFAVSDVVLLRPIPERLADLMGLWTGCVAGALEKDDYERRLGAAGFCDVDIEPTLVHGRDSIASWASAIEIPGDIDPEVALEELDGAVANAFIRARA